MSLVGHRIGAYEVEALIGTALVLELIEGPESDVWIATLDETERP
jgi:hypothetical protein